MKLTLKERSLSMKEFFDERVDTYDDVHEKFMVNKRDITRILPDGTAAVLDLGAGTGLELIALFERFPEARVTALDISEKMLDHLRARPFADKVEIRAGDFFEIPFGEGYDAVISSSALHHFTPEAKVTLYGKIFAALRPGGLFVNADWFAETQEDQDGYFRELDENPNDRPHIDTPLTKENERTLLTNAGFASVEFRPTEPDNYRLLVAEK